MTDSTEIKTVTFIGFLTTLFRNRRMIIRNFLIFSLLGLVLALVLPHYYTSTAVLMPPENQSGGLGLLSMVSDLPFDLSGAFGLGNTMSDVYIGILRSRNVRENIIKRFNLMELWEKDYMYDALQQLDGQVKIDITDEGLLTISVTTKSRQLSQKMCDAFVEELDRVNRTTRYTTAKHTREFIEKRLTQADEDLHKAAKAMRDFQVEHGVVSLEEQTVASIQAAADIQAKIALNEVEYDVLKKQLSKSHERVRLVENRLEALHDQLNRIEYGDGVSDKNLILPFSKIPDLGLQYVFLFKDLEVQKAIFELLTKQYEQAKIQEMRDTPTVEVLDKADWPDRKSKPKRSLIVLAAAFLSFFVSGFTIAVHGYMEQARQSDPTEYQQFRSAYEAFRADLKRFGRKTKKQS